jgi:uncharacterized protein YlxP (DUF503 family)
LELYLPHCHSLKEKRRVVKGTADRLRSRFKCAVAELEHQDLWQRSRLGIVSISSDRKVLERFSEKLERESERLLGGDLINCTVDIIEHE